MGQTPGIIHFRRYVPIRRWYLVLWAAGRRYGPFTFFCDTICSRGGFTGIVIQRGEGGVIDSGGISSLLFGDCGKFIVCRHIRRAWSLAHWGFCPPGKGISERRSEHFFFILLTENAHMEDFGASWHVSERIGNFRYQAPRYQCISSITERVSRLGVESPGAL